LEKAWKSKLFANIKSLESLIPAKEKFSEIWKSKFFSGDLRSAAAQ